MDLEIDKMNEEIIELREDNLRLQKMCSIVEQINDMLSEVISDCKCVSRKSFETKTNFIVLKDKYKQLKDTEHNFCSLTTTSLIKNSVSTQTGFHSVTKKRSIAANLDCFSSIDQTLVTNNVCILNNRQNLMSDDSALREGREEVILQQNDDIMEESKRSGNKLKVKTKRKKMVDKSVDHLKSFKTIKIKRREKKMSCDWPGCQMKFRDSYNLSVHKVRHTGQKSFVCCKPGCLKTYATKAALDVHHNSHSDNRRFKCTYSECAAAFIRKSQLNVHISQYHTRDFPYKCNWPGCEYQGCYLNRLNSHRLSHMGLKPFNCEWGGCDATFRLNHHLKAHMLKHTGEKPIPCGLDSCDRRFQSKQAMKIHFEKTHFKH